MPLGIPIVGLYEVDGADGCSTWDDDDDEFLGIALGTIQEASSKHTTLHVGCSSSGPGSR